MQKSSKTHLKLNKETLRVLNRPASRERDRNQLTATSCFPHCTCPVGPG